MVNFVVGFFTGALVIFLSSFVFKKGREKRGKREREYLLNSFTTRMKDTVRHIVFEYSIKRSNNDFLLNIMVQDRVAVQLMHRAHFSELCATEEDIEFGIPGYIPIEGLSAQQLIRLDSIFAGEAEPFRTAKFPVGYYVLDLGKRIRFGGYLMSRIVREVFNAEDANIKFEMFSEGALPYMIRK